jgi:heme exporter protein D
MNGLASFLAMGGYAVFVWPSYILTLVVLVILAFASFRASRKRSARLKDLQAASPHRQRRAAAAPAPEQEVRDGV